MKKAAGGREVEMIMKKFQSSAYKWSETATDNEVPKEKQRSGWLAEGERGKSRTSMNTSE